MVTTPPCGALIINITPRRPKKQPKKEGSGKDHCHKQQHPPILAVKCNCPFRKSYPDVMMVQTGQDWDGDNDTGPLHRPTQGRILAQGQVRAEIDAKHKQSSRRAPRRSLLCRSSVRGHRSEKMFSVLVVVLRPDYIAGQGFRSGQREIPLIASSRVLRALRLWAGDTRGPPLRAGSK